MYTATEQLLKDHGMIRKLLASLEAGRAEFPRLLATLERVVLGHAWFEDQFFLPALKARPLLFAPFTAEVGNEHADIAGLLTHLKTATDRAVLDAGVLTLRTLMDTHFTKEERVLFPLAEGILGGESLRAMAVAMEEQKDRVRPGGPVVP